jgi:hypothetical protein
MEFNINHLLERKQEVEKLIIDNNELYINCLNSDYDKFYDKYIINEDNIEYILDDTFEEGIYGILIYQFDLKYDKILNSDNITFHNKQNIVKKLLNNNDLNDYAKEQNYGILELYKIDENNIINLNKFFLLKNGNINHINNTSFDEINLDNLANDFIITKIYKIEDNNIIYKNSINKIDFINNVLKDYKFINYESLLNNIHNNRIIHHMSNFESIEMLKNINNNVYENDIFLLDDVLSFDFSNVIDKIKISNKYLKENYDKLIEKYFESDIDLLYKNIKTNKIDKIKNAIKIVLEILIRIFIDIKLNDKTYNLSKYLVQYIPHNNDNDVFHSLNSKSLLDRYLKNIVEFELKDIIKSIFKLLKKNNLKDVLSFLETII